MAMLPITEEKIDKLKGAGQWKTVKLARQLLLLYEANKLSIASGDDMTAEVDSDSVTDGETRLRAEIYKLENTNDIGYALKCLDRLENKEFYKLLTNVKEENDISDQIIVVLDKILNSTKSNNDALREILASLINENLPRLLNLARTRGHMYPGIKKIHKYAFNTELDKAMAR